MTFSPHQLLEILSTLPDTRRYWLAYSGGQDSHVLLYALAAVRHRLSAAVFTLHVDHGLQAESVSWSAHCARVCHALRIPFQSLRLDSHPMKGQSPEAWARQARYQALAEQMGPGDILLTAHHQDDQAETVLLQLLRGAGPRGLAAMPLVARFGPGYQARPLLGFSRQALQAYALKNQLDWIEDDSNQDTGFDRNYLRQRVLPLLRERWPGLGGTLSRSARHCAEAQLLIDEGAVETLENLLGEKGQTIAISGLRALSPPRARAVLRAWIRSAGFPLPDSARLERLYSEMIGARVDRNPLVRWPGVDARRYRDRLFLMPPLQPIDPGLILSWDSHSPLALPAGLGRLELKTGPGGISRKCWEGKRIEIRFRHRGERLHLPDRLHSQTFKNFFQQNAIPPWQRGRIPLIYLDGELAAVADLCLCTAFQSRPGEDGIHIRWERNTPR